MILFNIVVCSSYIIINVIIGTIIQQYTNAPKCLIGVPLYVLCNTGKEIHIYAKITKKNHESVFIFSEFQGEVGRRRNKIGIGSAFQLVSRTILMNNNNRTNFK